MLVILQQKDNTTNAQQSPRIPKDVSESDNGPVEKTEKHVSVEGPIAGTGRQEVKSGFSHLSCLWFLYQNLFFSLNLFFLNSF